MQDNHDEDLINVSHDKTETLQAKIVSRLLFEYLLHCTL